MLQLIDLAFLHSLNSPLNSSLLYRRSFPSEQYYEEDDLNQHEDFASSTEHPDERSYERRFSNHLSVENDYFPDNLAHSESSHNSSFEKHDELPHSSQYIPERADTLGSTYSQPDLLRSVGFKLVNCLL